MRAPAPLACRCPCCSVQESGGAGGEAKGHGLAGLAASITQGALRVFATCYQPASSPAGLPRPLLRCVGEGRVREQEGHKQLAPGQGVAVRARDLNIPPPPPTPHALHVTALTGSRAAPSNRHHY